MSCPRCGGAVAAGQEYCLECGRRIPGRARLGPPPQDPRRLALRLAVAAALAIGGAAGAVALTRDGARPATIATATGGSVTVAAPAPSAASRLASWPRDTAGWTNVLVSIPKVAGRDAAVARAEQARRRGVAGVGILDSSRYASLHPGYWVVFAGVYASEPEAASRLRIAKAAQRTARTQRVSP
ncbi:hypothetical protein Gocc_0757 [Gaiella occulta]|uniref:Sporulation related domain n=1 Tax=Gaiella occulta TaxID=1002870 RepID=A0A7M2YY71_9ACTN|nr:hypothetical protein [Gaiella occulta]RDI74959.1 hypothetical protein Gocc_0757 [Gaiella occulta]